MPNVPSIMPHDSFLALDRYFNASNRRAIPWNNPDRLILVRPVLDYIRERSHFLVVPSKNLSLDEGMMPYKGRLSIKVYNTKKPKKYGVKLFFITESNTEYVVDFSVYSGVFSTLRDTVFGLVDRFRNQGYHMFMDNYYNSWYPSVGAWGPECPQEVR
ncbi:piggyBac transposable element-derived protein 4-like [Macrobrachium nipponense]|uniref:piggyBac transposable element-derived protein 4-like n=1 Tax=Macrobrachium nipponense TaxID=159736 RepID=UPI0030C85E6A